MTSTAQAPAIRIERIGAFLLVTFNQPEQRNPLGPEVVAGLYQALDTAEADAGIRALAIRGAGPVFCAGGNLGNFADRLAAPPDADGESAPPRSLCRANSPLAGATARRTNASWRRVSLASPPSPASPTAGGKKNSHRPAASASDRWAASG